MKNGRVRCLGIALSAAVILGCQVPAAAAQEDTASEQAAGVWQQEETTAPETEDQETKEDGEQLLTENEGQTAEGTEETGEAETDGDTQREETDSLPQGETGGENGNDGNAVPPVTEGGEETAGTGSDSSGETTPAPTPTPEETPSVSLPQTENGWISEKQEDSDRVIWVLYKDSQIQELWTWEQTGNWFVYDSQDTLLEKPGIPADGYHQIGDWTFFLKEGVPQTGWQLNEKKNGWLYCLEKAGENPMALGAVQDPAERTGIQKINGAQYYLQKDGTFLKNTKVDQNGTRYVLGADGKVTRSYKPVKEQWIKNSTGWWYQHEDGSYPANCWEKIGGRWYSFDGRGYMRSGGWYQENGVWYYLENSGAAAEGWRKVGSSWYYLEPGTARMKTGWYQVKGIWYYSDASGRMYEQGWHWIGSHWFYMDVNGHMLTGWQYLNGHWFYMNASGYMTTGWQFVNGHWYYMNGSGHMLTGWQYLNGHWFYMDGSGHMLTGWQYIGGKWYYMNKDGYMLTGWQKIRNVWYYMDASGRMLTGWQKIGGTWYYMDGSGHMLTGWQKIGGKWYYMDGNGHMVTGWLKLGSDWYYLGSDGAMYANRWIGSYYLGADGKWDEDKKGDQLDILLQQVIDQVTTPAMSQEGKLRACYDYVVNSFSYERKYSFQNVSGWERTYALEMLTKRKGNCYNFAATFGCLAEKLGYSVNTIAGATGARGGGWTPHSWVEINMGGTVYIFDPEMEHANGYDLWKKTYATSVLRYKKF